MKPVGIGVIGCGNISAAYLTAAKKFPILNVVALSDANPAAAQARGAVPVSGLRRRGLPLQRQFPERAEGAGPALEALHAAHRP